MPVDRITSVSSAPAHTPQISATAASVLMSGNGDAKTWAAFVSPDGTVTSGVWESEAFCKKKAHPDSMEFCYILEGRVDISDTHGNVASSGAGDAFIVEPGFDGVWESLTRVRKYFVIAKCKAEIVSLNAIRASYEQVF